MVRDRVSSGENPTHCETWEISLSLAKHMQNRSDFPLSCLTPAMCTRLRQGGQGRRTPRRFFTRNIVGT